MGDFSIYDEVLSYTQLCLLSRKHLRQINIQDEKQNGERWVRAEQ